MKVVISGGSGLIGQSVAAALTPRADVAVLTRNPASVRTGRPVRWKPGEKGEWVDEVSTADAIVNLAGAGIGDRRWTRTRKKEIWDSRLDSTRAIVEVLGARSASERPVLVSASAIGYYGDRADEELDETSPPGRGFLSDLCVAWEKEAQASAHARVVILRIGFVLARDGGALPALLPLFRLCVGGRLGSGAQWMSWVHIEDVVRTVETAIADTTWSGVYNVVAPAPERNVDFTHCLARVLRRPAILPAPAFGLRVILGEMADSLLLGGQKVLPAAASERGFVFRYQELERALRHLLD